MNDEYAIEPTACDAGFEVRHLLRQFGPQEGRYVAKFPGRWKAAFFEHIEQWPDIDKRVAVEALARARTAFVASGREFLAGENWVSNLDRIQRSERRFAGAVVARVTRIQRAEYPSVEEFEPTLSDAYVGPLDAGRFGDLARPLIRLSAEVAMVDPFFRIGFASHREFLKAILIESAGLGCQSIMLWTRAEFADQQREDFQQVKEEAGFRGTLAIHPVSDAPGQTQFHDRYLLSIHGGLELSKGFQPSGRQHVVVKVIRGLLPDLVKIFLEKDNDLNIGKRFEV